MDNLSPGSGRIALPATTSRPVGAASANPSRGLTLPPNLGVFKDRSPSGPGATARPAPALMGVGVQEEVGARWEEMYQVLVEGEHTCEHQERRLSRIRELVRNYGEDTRDPVIRKELDRLVEASVLPFGDVPEFDLWACHTGLGLLLIFGEGDHFGRRMEDLPPAPLRRFGRDTMALTSIFSAVQMSESEVHPWAMAADTLGYLYLLG